MAEPALKVHPPRPAPRRAARVAKSVLSSPEEWIELSCPDWSRDRSKEPVAVELRSIDLEDVDTEVRAPDSAIRLSRSGVAGIDESPVSAPQRDPIADPLFGRMKWLALGVILGSVTTALLFLLLEPRLLRESSDARESARNASQPTARETNLSIPPTAIGTKSENGVTPTSRTTKQASTNVANGGKVNRSKPTGLKPSTSTKTRRTLTREKEVQH